MSQSRGRPRIIVRADIDAGKLLLARKSRRAPTAAEAAAWQLLRGRALFGLKFRRQQIVAGFIVDFYCAAARLALELDGAVHDDVAEREYDEHRSRLLANLSIRVVRLPNHLVDERALRDLRAPYAARLSMR